MSALDEFVPRGKRIHPYDFYVLITSTPGKTNYKDLERSPRMEDEADYLRNADKQGHVMEFMGETYFITASEPAITKEIA